VTIALRFYRKRHEHRLSAQYRSFLTIGAGRKPVFTSKYDVYLAPKIYLCDQPVIYEQMTILVERLVLKVVKPVTIS
jgi:hypothetical protein